MASLRGRWQSMGWIKMVALVAALLAASFSRAHGTLHSQIEEVNREILSRPRDAEPVLRRGEFYRMHGELDLAEEDLRRALGMDPEIRGARMALAEIHLKRGAPGEALAELDRDSRAGNQDARSWLLRAQACRSLGEHAQAARHFRRGRELSSRVTPGHYLDEANALFQVGGGRQREALALLEEAMRSMGPLVVLERAAFEFERGLGDHDAAIARARRLSGQAGAGALWALEEGRVWARRGSPAEAARAYQRGLDFIESLPPRRRGLAATRELKGELEAALAAKKP